MKDEKDKNRAASLLTFSGKNTPFGCRFCLKRNWKIVI
jgi:hypothetical protein